MPVSKPTEVLNEDSKGESEAKPTDTPEANPTENSNNDSKDDPEVKPSVEPSETPEPTPTIEAEHTPSTEPTAMVSAEPTETAAPQMMLTLNAEKSVAMLGERIGWSFRGENVERMNYSLACDGEILRIESDFKETSVSYEPTRAGCYTLTLTAHAGETSKQASCTIVVTDGKCSAKLIAVQRYARAHGIAAEYKASVAGGVAPYVLKLRIALNGKKVHEETKELAVAGEASFYYMPTDGGVCEAALEVTDAAGGTAGDNARVPVAVDDRECAQQWERTMRDVELTEDWRKDVIAAANTQMGYAESVRDFIVDDEGRTKGYTRYGGWYGLEYDDWCAMFVAFCLNYAKVPKQYDLWDASCDTWKGNLRGIGAYEDDEDNYQPEAGDLIFFNHEGKAAPEHIGIVSSVSEDSVSTIEGNVFGKVVRKNYAREYYEIVGYGSMRRMMDRAGVLERFEKEEEAPPEADYAIHIEISPEEVDLGDEITYAARVEGMENPEAYDWQWQCSADCENWIDVEGATDMSYTTAVTMREFLNYYRVVATPKAESKSGAAARLGAFLFPVARAEENEMASNPVKIPMPRAVGEVYWNPNATPTFDADGLAIVAAGNDANSGASSAAPVLTAARVLEVLQAGDKIVVMNEYEMYTGETFKPATVTSMVGYPGEKANTAHHGIFFAVQDFVTLRLDNVDIAADYPTVELNRESKAVLGANASLPASPVFFTAPDENRFPIELESGNSNRYLVDFHPEEAATDYVGVIEGDYTARFDVADHLKPDWSIVEKNGNTYALYRQRYEIIYLDGENGSDENYGNKPTDPVRTFARAKQLLQEHAAEGVNTICILGTATVSDSAVYELASTGAVDPKVTRYHECGTIYGRVWVEGEYYANAEGVAYTDYASQIERVSLPCVSVGIVLPDNKQPIRLYGDAQNMGDVKVADVYPSRSYLDHIVVDGNAVVPAYKKNYNVVGMETVEEDYDIKAASSIDVYWDPAKHGERKAGIAVSDANGGTSPEDAVESWGRALELLGQKSSESRIVVLSTYDATGVGEMDGQVHFSGMREAKKYQLDADGNPIVDENGSPVYTVESEYVDETWNATLIRGEAADNTWLVEPMVAGNAGTDLTMKNITMSGEFILNSEGQPFPSTPANPAEALVRVMGAEGGAATSLTLDEGMLLKNNLLVDTAEANWGGGVKCVNTDLTLNGAEIRDCTAQAGGAVSFKGGAGNRFVMQNGTQIADNQAVTTGGGLHLYGSGYKALFKGGSITGNTVQYRGGGVAVYGAEMTREDVDGCETWDEVLISDNHQTTNTAGQSYKGGGGVYVGSGSTCLTGNLKILENTAYNSGGGLYQNHEGKLYIYGGIEIACNSAHAAISGDNNGLNANDGGGSIRSDGQFELHGNADQKALIHDNSAGFDENGMGWHASSGGGVMLNTIGVNHPATDVISNARIYGNKAVGTQTYTGPAPFGGGGIAAYTSYTGGSYADASSQLTLEINDSEICDNGNSRSDSWTTNTKGGGVYVIGDLVMNGTYVTGNHGPSVGGVCVLQNMNVRIDDCTISGNVSHCDGLGGYGGANRPGAGGLDISESRGGSGSFCCTAVIRGGEISGNVNKWAGHHGGGVALAGTGYLDASLAITDCRIENNKADLGGGMYLKDAQHVTMSGGSVFGNTAVNDGCVLPAGETEGDRSCVGGGLYVDGECVLDGGNFEENTATSGGGAYVAGKLTLPEAQTVAPAHFRGNSAPAGGGMSVATDASILLKAGYLTENTADMGGGVYVERNGHADLADVNVDRNEAELGGGVCLSYGGELFNGNISENRAQKGGGVYVDAPLDPESGEYMRDDEGQIPTGVVTGSRICGNAADQGGGFYGVANAELISTAFTGNTARLGGAIFAPATDDGADAELQFYLNVVSGSISGNHSTGDVDLDTNDPKVYENDFSSGIFNEGRKLYMGGSRVEISDSIYLHTRRHPVTLAYPMRMGAMYDIALRAMEGAKDADGHDIDVFSYGDVVVEPNDNVNVNHGYPHNAAQYLRYTAPVQIGYTFAKGRRPEYRGQPDKPLDCIILKKCIFVADYGNDGHSGANPDECFRTMARALEEANKYDGGAMIYVCGVVTIADDEDWVCDNEVEIHRYTGFRVNNKKAYPAYPEVMYDIQPGGSVSIGRNVMGVYGWQTEEDAMIPTGTIFDVSGELTVDSPTIIGGNKMRIDSKGGAMVVREGGEVSFNADTVVSDVRAQNGGAFYNEGTINVSRDVTLKLEDVTATQKGTAVHQASDFRLEHGATFDTDVTIHLVNDKYVTLEDRTASVTEPQQITMADPYDGRIYVHFEDDAGIANPHGEHGRFQLENSVLAIYSLDETTENPAPLNLILRLKNVVYVNKHYTSPNSLSVWLIDWRRLRAACPRCTPSSGGSRRRRKR